MDDKLISKLDAADMLGVSVSTVERLIADGDLPMYKIRGQCRLMMSQLAKSSSSSVFLISGGSWKGDLDVYACTSMPKPMAMRAVL